MRTLLMITIVITPMLCGVGLGQTTGSERPAALNRLDFMEGRWKVTGGGGSGKGRVTFEGISRCEWVSRVMMCRDEALQQGEWGTIFLYSYNDRKGRYEGAFVDDLGQVVAHPVRWEGEQFISEYEYHVAGGYHRVRRTLSPKGPDVLQQRANDLGDERIAVAVELTATRLDK